MIDTPDEWQLASGVHFSDARLAPIWDRVRTGQRLDREDGLTLLETDDLLGLGRMADHVKTQREGDRVYFVINRYITPTNLCVLSCSFCGFARKPGEAGAYEHTIEDMVGMVKDDMREVHIVGGHHPDWPFEYYERMIGAIHAARPEVQIKAFTAAEIDYFWRRWKLEPREALTRLKAAGLHSMPGGGAEIFSPRLAKLLQLHGQGRSPTAGARSTASRTSSASTPTPPCSTATSRRWPSAWTTCCACASSRTPAAAS